MWNDLLFFEDEDEGELIDKFVKFSAIYKNRYTAFEICQHIFSGLRDPVLRAGQAANKWSNDLEIKERIRNAVVNGDCSNSEDGLTKDNLQQKMLSVVENEFLTPQEKKVRIEGYLAIAEINGWKIKAVEKTDKNKAPAFPAIVIAQYQDD